MVACRRKQQAPFTVGFVTTLPGTDRRNRWSTENHQSQSPFISSTADTTHRAERWSEALAPFWHEPGEATASFRHLFHQQTFRSLRANCWSIKVWKGEGPDPEASPNSSPSVIPFTILVERGTVFRQMFQPTAPSPRCETLSRMSFMFDFFIYYYYVYILWIIIFLELVYCLFIIMYFILLFLLFESRIDATHEVTASCRAS